MAVTQRIYFAAMALITLMHDEAPELHRAFMAYEPFVPSGSMANSLKWVPFPALDTPQASRYWEILMTACETHGVGRDEANRVFLAARQIKDGITVRFSVGEGK